MDTKEANTIIAKYMGYTKFQEGWSTNQKLGQSGNHWVNIDWFTSLDNLVPVWEKLRQENTVDGIELDLGVNDFRVTICSENIGHPYIKHRTSNLNEAATIATASAIILLDSKDNL